MFFDDHPEFLETSHTAASLRRLNLRHVGIIEENAEVLRGRSVIDMASHDGRWSFAALQAGARHVTGIEGRGSLIRNARRTFAAKGVPRSSYTMRKGDVHLVLMEPDVTAEVVMCLGFFYHTARYVELIAGIRSTNAEYVIVDTRILQDTQGPVVEFRIERTKGQALALKDDFAMDDRVLSAVPSEEALVLMLDAAGYDVDHRTDWPALISSFSRPGKVSQYATGKRITLRARRRADAVDASWRGDE